MLKKDSTKTKIRKKEFTCIGKNVRKKERQEIIIPFVDNTNTPNAYSYTENNSINATDPSETCERAKVSEHVLGLAVDIRVNGIPSEELTCIGKNIRKKERQEIIIPLPHISIRRPRSAVRVSLCYHVAVTCC